MLSELRPLHLIGIRLEGGAYCHLYLSRLLLGRLCFVAVNRPVMLDSLFRILS